MCQHLAVEAKKDVNKSKERNIKQIKRRMTLRGRCQMIAGLENRRSRKNGFFLEEVTAKDIENMVLFQEACCFYCFETILTTFELDHMHPASKGGKHEKENCVVTCRRCNRAKNDMDYEDWMKYLHKFILRQ